MTMNEPQPGAGFPWGAALLGLLILTVLAGAVGLPLIVKAHREERLRQTVVRMSTLCTAESDYFSNDRDGNGVKDYWTGDVAGLSSVRSAKDGTETRLIDHALACADSQPIVPPASERVPVDGYFLRAMDRDDNFSGSEGVYRADTDGSGRKVHNVDRFGFCGHPETTGSDRPVYIVNEYRILYHLPGGSPTFAWPHDYVLKDRYRRPD